MVVGRVLFFNDTATTEIYTLSLHDALPISRRRCPWSRPCDGSTRRADYNSDTTSTPSRPKPCSRTSAAAVHRPSRTWSDRKSTRLNSSHANISYAVFCLKKNNKTHTPDREG